MKYGWLLICLVAVGCGRMGKQAENAPGSPSVPANGKVVKSDEEWKRLLTPEQYAVTRQKETEKAFTGKYWDTHYPKERR